MGEILEKLENILPDRAGEKERKSLAAKTKQEAKTWFPPPPSLRNKTM